MTTGIVGTAFAGGGSGGIDTLFVRLLTALAAHGEARPFRVYVWPDQAAALPPVGANTTVVPVSPDWPLVHRLRNRLGRDGLSPVLRRYFQSEPVDLLHFPFTTIAPDGLDLPKVLTFCDMQHEFWPQFFSEDELAKRRATYRRSTQDATRIIAISEYTKQTLIDRYGTDPAKVVTVHPAHDEARFTPLPPHLPETEPTFFYPARRWPHKNHRRLLSAFARVVEHFSDARLVLTGAPDAGDTAITRQIWEHGLTRSVQFAGRIGDDDLPALYSRATAVVFPSLFEGFGIPVLEAMATGCPVACSNTTSLPEVAGDAAVYFDPEDATAIADAMIELAKDSALRASLREKGLTRAKQFTGEKMAAKTLAVYSTATQAHAPYRTSPE